MESLTHLDTREGISVVETAAVPPAATDRFGTSAWQWMGLSALVITAGAVFAWALRSLHSAYNSNAYDLAFFDQIVWNTSQGRWFQSSFVEYNFLGQHMQPVLLLYAGLYRINPTVEWLLLSQAAVVAGAAVPLFLAARRLLWSATAALLVTAAYLVSPHLHGAVLFDFHPEVMGAACIFAALALLTAGRPGWAVVALATIFLLKEDAAPAGAGFSVIAWLLGYRRYAAGIAAASVLYTLIVVAVLMPALRGGPGDLQERYGYLGDDTGQVIGTVLLRPDRIGRRLVAPPQRRALAYLGGSTALLPLLSPAGLAAVPLLVANLLSTHPAQRDLTLHYPAFAHALLIAAAVLGIRAAAGFPRPATLRRLSPRSIAVLLAAVLLVAEVTAWTLGSPLGPRRFDAVRYQSPANRADVARVLAVVPADAAISAQSGLLPHLAHRRDLWEFPRIEDADYVLVDRAAWRSSQSEAAGYDRTLRSLSARGFCPLRTEGSVTLYHRGEPCASRS